MKKIFFLFAFLYTLAIPSFAQIDTGAILLMQTTVTTMQQPTTINAGTTMLMQSSIDSPSLELDSITSSTTEEIKEFDSLDIKVVSLFLAVTIILGCTMFYFIFKC